MKRAIAVLVAGTAAVAAAPALAADLMEPVPVAPVVAPAPERSAFDWTGFYVGATAAYGWGDVDIDTGAIDASRSADGFWGGAYLGYNYAVTPNWIVGGEADVMLGESQDYTVGGTSVDLSSPVLSTVRARVGYAFDSFMVYGTGGLALGFGEAEIDGGGKDSNTHVGWTAGAGVEAALTENITARAEYLYVDTSSETYGSGGTTADADLDSSLVRVGVGYKF
jgi:outer membrane immunogenic protein